MSEPTQEKTSQKVSSSAEKVGNESGSLSAAPPAFQLKASTSGTAAPAQMKTDTVTLPEKLGSTQSGDIATKGTGDKNAFSPNDVNQGSIGDCYFLASLVAVANTNPELLRKAITDNKNGSFTVKLFKPGEEGWWIFKKRVLNPVNVTIYPTFPVSVDGNDSANAHAGTNPAHAHGGDQNDKGQTELWVRLIEKAYALLHGSYKAIGNGGFGSDALEALTGKQYKEKVLASDTKDRIIEMVEAGVPVEVATSNDKFKSVSGDLLKFAQDNSIVGGHSYAVMSATKSKIKVRNPWGSGARVAEPEMTWDQFDKLFNQFADMIE